jgi:hypothetical protein
MLTDLRALYFCREKHQRRNCTTRKKKDRAVQKIEGPNAMLEHKLSVDTFFDGNFDTKAMVVFRSFDS